MLAPANYLGILLNAESDSMRSDIHGPDLQYHRVQKKIRVL